MESCRACGDSTYHNFFFFDFDQKLKCFRSILRKLIENAIDLKILFHSFAYWGVEVRENFRNVRDFTWEIERRWGFWISVSYQENNIFQKNILFPAVPAKWYKKMWFKWKIWFSTQNFEVIKLTKFWFWSLGVKTEKVRFWQTPTWNFFSFRRTFKLGHLWSSVKILAQGADF